MANRRGTKKSPVSEGKKDSASLPYRTLLLLAAVSYGPEAMVNFEAIYGILSLQYLGVPVSMVSLNGLLCTSLSMFLIPTLGSFADNGTNPKKRRMMSLLISLSAFTFGFGLFVIACGIRAKELKDVVKLSNSTQQTGYYAYPDNIIQSTNTPVRTSPNTSFTITAQVNNTAVSHLSATISDQRLTTGILGILGLMFLDMGFDTSMSQIKTFLIDSVPEHQNVVILTTSTLIAAFGGVLVSFVGTFDLPSLLGPVLNVDGVAAALIVVCVGISLTTLLVYAASLTTRHRLTRRTKYRCRGEEQRRLLPSENASEVNVDSSSNASLSPRHHLATKPEGESTVYGTFPSDKECLVAPAGKSARESSFTSQWAFVLDKRLVLVFIASFLSFGALLVICVYISNTLTIEVVKGDPQALPGTSAKIRYEQGLRVSSRGLLIANLIYVAISLVNKKLINFLGAKLLFLLSNVLMCGACVVFCVAQTVSTFYFLMIVYGPYRCMTYTLPFLLATTLLKKDEHQAPMTDAKPANLAKVISLLGFLFTANYFILSCFMGPLMDALGSAWPPAYYLIGSCAVATLPSTFLLFM